MVVSIEKPILRPIPWARWAVRYELRGPAEAKIVCFLFTLLVAFKLINTACYPFNSDEPQHLHVVWGWARGFVQYRDLCDNHMPLFQILCAPLYALVGDRASILCWMRFILLPLSGVVAWATYRIGTLLFSRRVGIWAVILAGFYPGYHYCSLQFRTDNLWAPLLVLSVLLLVEDGLTRRSACKAGVLMGLAFAVSMKTSLFFVCVGAAGFASYFAVRSRETRVSLGELASRAALFLLTTALIPGIVVLAFVRAGVWPDMRYWVFENNIVSGLRDHPAWWGVVLPITLPLAVMGAAWIARRAPDRTVAARRVFVFLLWAFYVPALWAFWPLITGQDYLPYQPIAFPLYTAALLFVARHVALHFPRTIPPILLGPLPVAAGFFLIALLAHPFWKNGAKLETELLRSTLALTNPSDFVLDMKGETVFRQRAFKPIWEPFVLERIRRGLMQDDAPERCVATRTCVATRGKDMSERTTRFVEQHFLPVGSQLYVAGAWLVPSQVDRARDAFETVIPADYTIISADGAVVHGTLDGKEYDGETRTLPPGQHEFAGDTTNGNLALLWTQAVKRGFHPLRP